MTTFAKTAYVCADKRGTEEGYRSHNSGHGEATPCSYCVAAHRAYVAQLFAAYGITPASRRRPSVLQPRVRSFIEDYLWLYYSGVTHGEALAKRLGTSPESLTRRLYRAGITPLHPFNDQAKQ